MEPKTDFRKDCTVPSFVRLLHKTLLDGRYHVYTSPDVQGFHVAMETIAEATRAAIVLLDKFAELDGAPKPDSRSSTTPSAKLLDDLLCPVC